MKRLVIIACVYLAAFLLCAPAKAQTPYVPTCLTPAQVTTVTQSTAALAPILLFDETDAALRFADQQCINMKMATGLLADVAQAKTDIAALKAATPVPGPTGPQGIQGLPGPTGPAGASSPAAPISDTLLASCIGAACPWALTPTLTELFGTRRIFSMDNVHSVRTCVNNVVGAGAGSTYSLETVSYNSAGAEVVTTLAGPLDISIATIPRCAPWTSYSGPGGDALIRVRGQAPVAATLLYISISMQAR